MNFRLCLHFFNRLTLVLGFNQLFHNKKCNYWKEQLLLPGVICLCGCGGQKLRCWAVIRKGEKTVNGYQGGSYDP
jgi:hypothetical protein